MPRRPRRVKGGEGDLFDGLPLAPPGLPELICRWCGSPKIPRQRCATCNSEPRNPPTEAARIAIENWKRKKLNETKKKWDRIHEAASTRKRRSRRRMAQVAELDRLLVQIMACFERDRGGDWQLYADRLAELQLALNEAELLLPRIRALRKYTEY